MMGRMIKICSLDFLNKDKFETDILDSDGNVLFYAGHEITPDLLLRLYFKDIYVSTLLFAEKESKIMVSVAAESEGNLDVSYGMPQSGDQGLKEITYGASVQELEGISKDKDTIYGPIQPADNVEDDSNYSYAGLVPGSGDVGKQEGNSKGPRSVEYSDEDAAKVDDKTTIQELSAIVEENDEIDEVEEVVDDDPQLKFDEAQAKDIVKFAQKLGNLLKLSANELKDLELVAYNYNIGIDRFKKSDSLKKQFRSLKAYASYEKLINEGVISTKIAEMVKMTASGYDSNAFPLSDKIPIANIVSIVGYYVDLLSGGLSKDKVLLKMLQLGGNQFNIFALHKFIKMMRELDE